MYIVWPLPLKWRGENKCSDSIDSAGFSKKIKSKNLLFSMKSAVDSTPKQAC